MKGSEQYSANMETRMSTVMCSLVSSVAVRSMKTSFVSRLIFVSSLLICEPSLSVDGAETHL